MKRITIVCMVTMLIGGLAFSQEQDIGLSNTVYTDFGNVDNLSPIPDDTDLKFHGFTNFFTANIDLGRLVIAGDISWRIRFGDDLSAKILNPNFNVVIKPFTGFDIGVGTNLDWEIGPAPSYEYGLSAYNVLYYAGLPLGINALTPLDGAVLVQNNFAQRSLAIRYNYDGLIEAGFALHDVNKNDFNAGIGLKANIFNMFSIGFAYNGDFETSNDNAIYVGSKISAIYNFLIDVWWNLIPNGKNNALGSNTIGTRIDFIVGAFRFRPEFSATFWNDNNFIPSMYVALQSDMNINNSMKVGINASWGLGSDFKEIAGTPRNTAGARVNINPYFSWNINFANELSVGAYFMPVWWQTKPLNGNKRDFYWAIPIVWKVYF